MILIFKKRTEGSSAQQPITKSFRQVEDQFVIENILRRYRQDLANEMAALTRNLMASPFFCALFGSILGGRQAVTTSAPLRADAGSPPRLAAC